MQLTLSTGLAVTLRPVDFTGGQPLTLHEALTSSLARQGMLNAKEAGERLAALDTGPDIREPDHWPQAAQVQLRAARDAELGLLRRGLVAPTLDGLLEVYGGDMTLPDLGLGPDFQTLLNAVRGLSGLSDPGDPDTAHLFLREWGSTLDAVGKRYGRRPSDFFPFPPGTLERERLALDLGVYYWARGEDAHDEWHRKSREQIGPKRPS